MMRILFSAMVIVLSTSGTVRAEHQKTDPLRPNDSKMALDFSRVKAVARKSVQPSIAATQVGATSLTLHRVGQHNWQLYQNRGPAPLETTGPIQPPDEVQLGNEPEHPPYTVGRSMYQFHQSVEVGPEQSFTFPDGLAVRGRLSAISQYFGIWSGNTNGQTIGVAGNYHITTKDVRERVAGKHLYLYLNPPGPGAANQDGPIGTHILFIRNETTQRLLGQFQITDANWGWLALTKMYDESVVRVGDFFSYELVSQAQHKNEEAPSKTAKTAGALIGIGFLQEQ
jgi:hypothetical protein